ncbi:MAG: LysR family transcriptional regulator [Verrucomicrobiales bacterium]|nr:LysR family transcriptional regulator [Verrucomicrobiales bacterium]
MIEMDVRQLKYFATVVDQGSFTAAAEKLSIAQPSLSQQILNLEEELGEPLLRRHRSGVELTEAGGIVLTTARRVIGDLDQLRNDFEKRSELLEGEIHIGVIPTIAPYLLPPVIASFREQHPAVRIHIRETFTMDLLSLLGSGEIDFAIASDVPKHELTHRSLHMRELFQEPLLLAVPSSHPLAGGDKRVRFTEIPEDELILLSEGHCLSDQVITACRTVRSPERIECGQLETLLSLIGSNLGLSIIPEMASKVATLYDVKLRRLSRPQPRRTIASLRKKSLRLSPAARAFFDHFHETTDEISL